MRLLFIFNFLFVLSISYGQSQYQALSIDKSLTDNANAVVRLDKMDIEILSKKEMVIKNKQVVTVLNELGHKHTRSSLGYDRSKKIKSLEVIIYNASGEQIKKIKKKDFKDINAADGFSLYSDYRVLYYDYTPVTYPYTMEFNYELVTSDTGSVPSWYFLGGFSASVEKSSYSISYTSNNLRPIILEKNLDDLDFKKKDTPTQIQYTADNIPAIKFEKMAPSFGKIAPKLMTWVKNFHYKGYEGSVGNWKDMGLWVDNQLLKGRDDLNPETVVKAKELVKGISDNLEKAKIIYKYVQENTRYISVQIGIGGLQPISAIDVDKVKYGDCKGLSNYTKALLNAVGVPSYYVVVEAGRDKIDFEEDFADLAQGNHVILTIPYNDKYYWVDCTSQVLPFGFVGSFTDDRKVMIIKPDGGEILKTPTYLNKDNYQQIKASYKIKPDGDINGTATIKTKGVQYYNHFRLNQESKEEVIQHYKENWGNINNLQVVNYELENDQENIVFTEQVSLKATNFASKSGERILVTANAFNNGNFVPDRYRNRKLPFEIQRGFFDEDEFTIQLPEGFMIEAIPSNKSIENEFGKYEVSFVQDMDSNEVIYKRNLLVKKGLYPKEKYNDYRNFRKEVSKMDNAQIVLLKNNQ